MPQTDESREEAPRSLDERLAAAEAAQQRQASGEAHLAMAQGYRFLGEVVGGVLGGAGLGWLVDRYAGTGPWGLVGGLLIGTGLSIFVAVRTAARMNRLQAETLAKLPSVPDEEED